jgi:phosphatidylserine synthase
MRTEKLQSESRQILLIPNLLTLTNLAFGVLGIHYVFKGSFGGFILCFVMCLVFDSLDGWYARLKHQETLLGFYLDTVADILSFGLLTSLFVCKFILGFNIAGILAGLIYILGNIVRHMTLVRPEAKRVLGVTNVVSSCLIVGIYSVGLTESIWAWISIICALTLLMLTPVEFFNHKKFKNQIIPRRTIYGLLYCLPAVLAISNLQALWWIVVGICVLYIAGGLSKSGFRMLPRLLRIKGEPIPITTCISDEVQ